MPVVRDPICGKEVDPLRARAVGIFGGVTYYFCSQDCKAKYVDPRKTPRAAEPQPEPSRKDPSRKLETKKDPSLELSPMPEPERVTHDGDDGREPTPSAPQRTPPSPSPSPSVIAEVREPGSRRWAVVIVILAALVVAAAVLSLRN
jgi:YHS domain-containing protein